jgi:hypothetical protein
MIGAETQRRAWRPGGRRPGHPRHRTVRHHRRPAEDHAATGTMAPAGGHPAQAHRRRTGHPRRHASPAWLCLRGPLAAPRQSAPSPAVPLPARPVRLQQAAAPHGRADPPRHPGGRLRYRAVERRGCIWCAPCMACRSPSRLPAPKHPSRRYCWIYWPPSRSWWPHDRDSCCWPTRTISAASSSGCLQRRASGVRLLRPARKGEPERAGAHLFRPLRQLIESVNQTFKGQLDLERHGGRTPVGVAVRVLQRILALTTAIWHNHRTGQATLRSLVAYDSSRSTRNASRRSASALGWRSAASASRSARAWGSRP